MTGESCAHNRIVYTIESNEDWEELEGYKCDNCDLWFRVEAVRLRRFYCEETDGPLFDDTAKDPSGGLDE